MNVVFCLFMFFFFFLFGHEVGWFLEKFGSLRGLVQQYCTTVEFSNSRNRNEIK